MSEGIVYLIDLDRQKMEQELALLRKIASAGEEMLEVIEMLHPNMNPDEPCVCYEAWKQGKQALSDYATWKEQQ